MNRVIWIALILVLGTGIGHAHAQTRKAPLEERVRDLEQANAERAAEVKHLQWERERLIELLGSNVQRLREEMRTLLLSRPPNEFPDYMVGQLKNEMDDVKLRILLLQERISAVCKIDLFQLDSSLRKLQEALRCSEY